VVEIQSIATIVTIIAGFATAAAVIFLGYQTMKLRNERNMTLRAWLGQGESRVFVEGYFNKDDKYIPHKKWIKLTQKEKDEFNVTKIRRYVEIKNYGQLPATNVRVRTKFFVDEQPTRKDIETISFGTSSSTIMSEEVPKLFFVLNRNEEDAIENTSKSCYLIYDVEYESPKKKKRKFGRIDSISIQNYGIIDSWDEDD